MRWKYIPTLFLSLLLTSNVFSQGAIDGFLKKKGELDLALTYSFESAPLYFAGPNELILPRNINTVGLYATYGITNNFGVVTSIPLVDFKLQDASVFLKYGKQGIALGKMKLSVIGALGFSSPMADYETETSLAIGQQATLVQPRIVTQLQLNSNWFVNGRYGYNYAFDPVPSGHIYSVKVGYFKNKFYTDLWVEQQAAVGGKDYRGVGDLAPSTFRELGVSYTKIGGVLYYQLKPAIGTFLSGGYTLTGRNVFQSTRLSVGMVLKTSFLKKKS